MIQKPVKESKPQNETTIGYNELTSFFYLLVDSATNSLPNQHILTDIRCFVNGCPGMIETYIDSEEDKLLWNCTICGGAGAILHWKGSEWDNTK